MLESRIEWSCNEEGAIIAQVVTEAKDAAEKREIIFTAAPGTHPKIAKKQYYDTLRERTTNPTSLADRRSGNERRSALRIDSLDRRSATSAGKYVIHPSPAQAASPA